MKLSYPGTISTITRTFDIRLFASLQSTYVPPLGSSVLATIFLREASASQCYALRLPLILATFTWQMAIETTKFYMAASATGLQRHKPVCGFFDRASDKPANEYNPEPDLGTDQHLPELHISVQPVIRSRHIRPVNLLQLAQPFQQPLDIPESNDQRWLGFLRDAKSASGIWPVCQ
jgi:hypothetical protein